MNLERHGYFKKILVTAYDLEQIEHRGIAVFSKNLLRALSEMGFEVWLLTSARHNFENLNDSIVAHLSIPSALPQKISQVRLLPGFHYLKKLLPKKFKHAIRKAVLGGYGDSQSIQHEFLTAVQLAPKSWDGRLSYLNFVTGFINIPNIFTGSIALVESTKKSARIAEVEIVEFNFDGVISTCPLPLRFVTNGWRMQTVHDLIPIDIPSDHPWDDPLVFAKRVDVACRFSELIVGVSFETLARLHQLGFVPHKATVLYQPRSFSDQLFTARSPSKADNAPYIVSIGSVEPRKNILIALEAFLDSTLPARGFHYLVVGDIKSGRESRRIRALSERHKEIKLTGYVSDTKRDELLFGADCLVFPSILEGYGIPLVDGIQAAKKILCSDIPVFREIAQDNANFVEAKNKKAWISAFNLLDEMKAASPNPRYEFSSFKSKLASLLDEL